MFSLVDNPLPLPLPLSGVSTKKKNLYLRLSFYIFNGKQYSISKNIVPLRFFSFYEQVNKIVLLKDAKILSNVKKNYHVKFGCGGLTQPFLNKRFQTNDFDCTLIFKVLGIEYENEVCAVQIVSLKTSI